MKTLRHIMRQGFLFTLQRDTTVADACRMMAVHNVGIVAVLDGERLCGCSPSATSRVGWSTSGSNPLVRDWRR